MIWSLTEVPPERLKILGLTTSKLQPIDSDVIGELQIKKGGKFMALGASSARCGASTPSETWLMLSALVTIRHK